MGTDEYSAVVDETAERGRDEHLDERRSQHLDEHLDCESHAGSGPLAKMTSSVVGSMKSLAVKRVERARLEVPNHAWRVEWNERLMLPSHRGAVGWVPSSQKNKKTEDKEQKNSTRTSRVVPDHNTTLAVSCLTSEFGWDPVLS